MSSQGKIASSSAEQQAQEGERRCLNSELWHACAGPLVSLPTVGSRVVYFPQGHSEQVAASTNKEIDSHIPNYPSLPPQLICQLHDVTMHADSETDEVYAQMTLQPLSLQEQKDPYLPAELGSPSKQPTNYFCKTLTASDTSTHGGFSVPRRAAEKVFPPLDFSQQPPAQELIARDIHDNEWKFRHIFRGQPKRHLLTTGWSVFVSAKRLAAGDSVLFIWNDNNQLLLGIRHANRAPTVMPSSVLSSDSMHIGLLAAAAHAAATNSRFTIFYNPRASPSEFVIPLAKYAKAVYHTRVSIGMRFRMLFETEESSVRRYMGTITGISDLDAARWPNSHWRSVKVGWDESTAGERQPRVSLWEIEPLTTFPMYPSPFPLRLKRPWPNGFPSLSGGRGDDMGLNSPLMWFGDGDRAMQSLCFQGLGVNPWMQPRLDASMLGLQPDIYQAMAASALHEMRALESPKQATTASMQCHNPQSMANRSTSLTNPFLQQMEVHPEHSHLQNGHEDQGLNQLQSQFHQHQLQQCVSFGNPNQLLHPSSNQQHQNVLQQQQHSQIQRQQNEQQQQELKKIEQQHHHQMQPQQLLDPQQIPNLLSVLPHIQSQQGCQMVPSMSHQQNFPDPTVNPASSSGAPPSGGVFHSFSPEEASSLLNLSSTNPLVSAGSWPSKRMAIESLLSSGIQCVPAQLEQFGNPQGNGYQHPITFPSLDKRECSLGQNDLQNHQIFGVNVDSSPSSLLMQNGLANIQNIGNESGSMTMPYSTTNFLGTLDSTFPFNRSLTNARCLEESGYSQSSENIDQANSHNGTFVKVYKSGSCGRSLDITKFTSYPELRSELGRMFGLDGQLEDSLRSGWQLVFIDGENDVLLVGDDPWQEFVNNVSCIKILSPQEVSQMGKDIPNNTTGSESFDGYLNHQDSRPLGSGIASLRSFDY